MSKKRRRVISKKKWKEKRLAQYPQPKFAVGNLVQVNNGVMDANWDDLPLGGWVGEITLVHREADGPKYDVRWTKETLEQAHPVYNALAELEGLRMDEYQKIDENDLHPFTGGPVVLTEPTDVSQYTDRPLDPTDRVDRLRMLFDTKPLEWFPMLGDGDDEDEEYDNRLLRRFYDHLTANLSFPFEAVYADRSSGKTVRRPFTVEKLIDPDVTDQAGLDVSLGLYCAGTDSSGELIEVPLQKVIPGDGTQEQLIKDYHSWIGVFLLGYDTDWLDRWASGGASAPPAENSAGR